MTLVAVWLCALILVMFSSIPPAFAALQAEADVLVARGVLAYDDQRYDESLELFRRALNLDPPGERLPRRDLRNPRARPREDDLAGAQVPARGRELAREP